ncbi:hypothetical protein FB45DRAFT_731590 [Roridomyces roridus]|uniref:Uncharacterized protein n=1 Tax=Roridomyces roridus TaxID=1738132 RepID=A0AAD7FZ35_9AGAR|nr:hypothetical protein FB45DRAFT_731590 [Roridomyces roridus]
MIATPSPVYTTNAVDDFFGTRLPCTSRFSDVPPAYDGTEYVAYRMRGTEPATLAMYLFKFGFLFPPFWLVGVFILFSPLRAPNTITPGAWLPEKTETERVLILRRLRTVELKWARRCLYALLALIHIIIAVVVGVVLWHALRRA